MTLSNSIFYMGGGSEKSTNLKKNQRLSPVQYPSNTSRTSPGATWMRVYYQGMNAIVSMLSSKGTSFTIPYIPRLIQMIESNIYRRSRAN